MAPRTHRITPRTESNLKREEPAWQCIRYVRGVNVKIAQYWLAWRIVRKKSNGWVAIVSVGAGPHLGYKHVGAVNG